MKPTKHAVAFVIYNEDRSKFLVVQRPADDENLPNVWGLPASSLKEGESFEEATVRAGKDKLGVQVKTVKLIGEDSIEREKYVLHMKEYEVEIVEGEPEVPQPIEGVTQYQQWRWGTGEDLCEAAGKASLCCKIYLDKEKVKK